MTLQAKHQTFHLEQKANYLPYKCVRQNLGNQEHFKLWSPTLKTKWRTKKLEPIILHYYTHYHWVVHPSHHHLFHSPSQLWITFSPQENKQWIKTVKLAIKIHKKKQKIFYAKHQKITRFIVSKKRKSLAQPQEQSQEKTQETQNSGKFIHKAIYTLIFTQEIPQRCTNISSRKKNLTTSR